MSSLLNVSVSAKRLATSRPAVAIRVALPSPLSPLSLSPLSHSWHLSASATATASLFCVPQHDDYTKLNASCIRIACHCMRARASACVCVCVNLSVEKWSPVSAVWLRLVWFALLWSGLVWWLLFGFIINVVACRVRCLPFHCVQTTSECVPVCVCLSVCVTACVLFIQRAVSIHIVVVASSSSSSALSSPKRNPFFVYVLPGGR